MKKLIIIGLILFPCLLMSQTIEKDIFGNTIIKDRNGQNNRTIRTDIFGDKIIEDGDGKTIRKISKDIFGDIIIEGQNREILLKISKDISGNIIIQGVFDRRMRRAIRNYFIDEFIKGNGNNELIIKDKSGVLIREIEKDIFGDYIIKNENRQSIRTIRKNIFDGVEVLDENRNVILEVSKEISEDDIREYVFDEIESIDDFFVNSLIIKLISERK